MGTGHRVVVSQTAGRGIQDKMNGLNKAISILSKVGIFSRWTNVIGIAVLFLMVCVTFVDVILRYIFNSPIKGVLEITEVLMILAVFLAVAHTQNEKAHVTVDLVTGRLSPKARIVMELITALLGLGIFAVAIWRVFVQTLYFAAHNQMHSQYFNIPSTPFAAIIVLGCTLLWLLLLRDYLSKLVEGLKSSFAWHQWLWVVIVPVVIIVLAVFWMQPDLWKMSLSMVGLIGVIVSLILFLMGMPISFALILTSFVFVSHIRGLNIGLDMVGTELYRTTGSYSYSVLPFFVLMGFMCLHARFGEDLYFAAYKWVGHLKGGMAIATIGACTGFAAIVGDSVAATATMGAVALPQMRKYHYDDRLSAGSIVGGATLGPIIPPSVVFILFGLLTKVSIGDLFIAGIFPGLVIAAVFCGIIFFWCRINPKAGPAGEKSSWVPRLISLRAGGPVLVLFVVVIGGIYMGAFTPTEGGAIGAVVAFLLGLIMRRFTWKSFSQTLIDGGKTVSMVFLILIGGLMFTRLAAWCNMSSAVANFINGLGLPAPGFMVLVMVLLLILGCFIDLMPLLLIGVPILFPIAMSMGINPIWFGMLVCITINVGAITPPVGINLFVLKGLNKEIPMGVIYTGSLPFCIGTIVAIAILFFVPAISTWLPAALK